MSIDVVCLRPEADFARVGATVPPALQVAYRTPNDTDVPALLRQAHGMVIPAVGPKLGPELFEDTALKLIQVTGAGIDRIDVETVQRYGIAVANVPGGSNSAVAEYVVTCASLLLRRLAWADAEIRKGNYATFRSRMIADNLCGLEGLLVGVVGFGTIGRAVARAFWQAGARICYYDPAPAIAPATVGINAQLVTMEELLTRSDVVTLHVPLLPATRNLIGAAELARMRPGAVLIQASRGGVVDEAALAAQLSSGHLGGAAIDVYESEPPDADNPLIALQGEASHRLLFTPHIAGVSRQAWASLFRAAWNNVERVLLHGEEPLNRII